MSSLIGTSSSRAGDCHLSRGAVAAPAGGLARLVRARGAGEVGRLLAEGAIVEVDREAARACGAAEEDCLGRAEALAARR